MMRSLVPGLLILLPLAGQTPPPPVTSPALPDLSVIQMPIQINLEPMFQQVEQKAPRVPPGVETWVDLPVGLRGATAYRFNLYRDPLRFLLNGQRLTVRTEAHYWLQIGLKVGSYVKPVGACGLGPEGHRSVLMGVSAEVGVTPQWGLDVKVRPLPVEPLSTCEVTLANVDITSKVTGGMQDNLVKATSAMEQQLRGMTLLRDRAQLIWRQLQSPLEVAPGIFLMVQPERIRLGAWTSQRKVLTIPIEVQARPLVVMGKVPVLPVRDLPALENAGSGGGIPAFLVKVHSEFGFAEATQMLRKQLAGQVFETEKGTFEVVDIAVRGEADKVLLDLDLKGRIKGRLTLSGRPVLDAATGGLRLDELDFTLESRNWITKMGAWLFQSKLRKTLADKANFMAQKNLADLRDKVQAGLNRTLVPGVSLQGQLQDFQMGQPQVSRDGVQVDAFMKGVVGVRIDGISL